MCGNNKRMFIMFVSCVYLQTFTDYSIRFATNRVNYDHRSRMLLVFPSPSAKPGISDNTSTEHEPHQLIIGWSKKWYTLFPCAIVTPRKSYIIICIVTIVFYFYLFVWFENYVWVTKPKRPAYFSRMKNWFCSSNHKF